MLKWFKRRSCDHDFQFRRNLYGDAVNWYSGRSLWVCSKCGKKEARREEGP